MTITKEKINGVEHNLVWHEETKDKNLLGRRFAKLSGGALAFFKDANCLHHIATALPPLPRYPKPSDAALLYRYVAEGITPVFKWRLGSGFFVGVSSVNIAGSKNSPVWLVETPRYVTRLLAECPNAEGWEITHALHNGQRVDVAITEGRE
jgi:hypothetical protein